MNIRKNIDYSNLYAGIDKTIATNLSQMELYLELGRLVSSRPEKGAAVIAAEYIATSYSNKIGFSPRNLRRMRDFFQMYEEHPKILREAMKVGWTQNIVIMEADLDMESRYWYLRAVQQFSWSKAELVSQIAMGAHLKAVKKKDTSNIPPVQAKRHQEFIDIVVAFLDRLWYNKSRQIHLFRQTEIICKAYG